MRRVQLSSLLLLCLSLIVFSANVIASPKLDANESAIVACSENHSEEAIDLLKKHVNINSGSLNQEGVKEVGASIACGVGRPGFRDPVGRHARRNAAWRSPYLESMPGTRGKRVLLIGHLDTVFEPDDPFQTFTPGWFKGNRTGHRGHEVRRCRHHLCAQGPDRPAGVLDGIADRGRLHRRRGVDGQAA